MPEARTDMSRSQVEARMRAIEEELERLRNADEERGALDDTDDQYFEDLCSEHDELVRMHKQKRREERFEQVQGAVRNPRSRVQGSYPNEQESVPEQRDSVQQRRFRDPWDLSDIRASLTLEQRSSELHARALSAIERMPAAGDRRRETMTQIIERYDDPKTSRLANLLLLTSSEQYFRAFSRAIANNGEIGMLDDDDRRALTAVRAISTVDTEGGFMIPFQLDPSVINTADGSFNPVRQMARNVVATTNEWHGVSSDGVTGRWAAEGTESQDGSPALSQPSVPLHKLDVFVPISIEASQDAANVANEVASMIAFEKDVMESVAFVTGDGANKPTGIVTELSGTTSEVAGSGTAFAEEDLYNLDESLPMRYNVRSQWLAHKAVYNTILKDFGQGDQLWGDLETGGSRRLLNHPHQISEAMDSETAPGTAATSNLMILGDWQNYVVADRVGTTVEFVPHVFGPNGRPTGQRGWYAYARVGGRSVNNGGFRMLSVSG